MLAVVLDNGTCELWDWEAETMTCRMEPGKSECSGQGEGRRGRLQAWESVWGLCRAWH